LEDVVPTWIEVARASGRRKAQELALVLQAVGIPHGLAENEGAFVLLVRSEQSGTALDQLARYERENRGWPPVEEAYVPGSAGIPGAILYVATIGVFFLFEQSSAFGVDWVHAGRVQAEAVRSGQWWRCLTALCLHADLIHLAGNVVFGSLFAVLLAQGVGPGLAWLGFLLAGAAGNYANAWIQPASHGSIGASTGLFGALGVLVAFEWARRRRFPTGGWRRWAPFVMGLALLGFLGTGGGSWSESDNPKERQQSLERILERVDVLAHVTGFAAGTLIGLGFASRWARVLRARQALSGALVVVLLALAWVLALRSGAG
jgi:rhomboid protease GluP